MNSFLLFGRRLPQLVGFDLTSNFGSWLNYLKKHTCFTMKEATHESVRRFDHHRISQCI